LTPLRRAVSLHPRHRETQGTLSRTPAEISGTFLTKVFEGCFRETGQSVGEMKKFVTSRGREMKDLFF
jgi:hypothetical protein